MPPCANQLPSELAAPLSEHGTGAPQLSLLDWALHVGEPQSHTIAAHHHLIIEKLNDIAAGRIDRLMLLLPPGHGKSTYASSIFPAWWFTRHPATSIISACHTDSLASHFARHTRALVRENAETLGYELSKEDRGASRWRTSNRGDYFACGVRGPITGRRADLVLIDDPVKNMAEAVSAAARNTLWNWYRADLLTRLRPQGRIILIMTRWHEDDLGGRILQNDPSWTVLRLPALAEENDPMGREPGAALWPEAFDQRALERTRHSVGPRYWQATYQQNPTPDADALFLSARIQVLDQPPSIIREIRAWDLAGTQPTEGRDPDWTVGLKLAVTSNHQYVITDIVRLREGPIEIANAICATASQDGPSVTIGLAQDPGQAGKQQIAWLTTRLAGHRVRASPETGSKFLRAQPAAAAVDAGMLSMVRAGWNRTFLDELRDFPNGRKDDQVDALSRAFSLVSEVATQPRRLNVPMMAR